MGGGEGRGRARKEQGEQVSLKGDQHNVQRDKRMQGDIQADAQRPFHVAGRHAGYTHAGRQAGRQAGGHTFRQADGQEGMHERAGTQGGRLTSEHARKRTGAHVRRTDGRLCTYTHTHAQRHPDRRVRWQKGTHARN